MPNRTLSRLAGLALSLAAVGLFAAAGRSAPAPAPKDAPPTKTPDGGVAAEPADGDADQAAKYRKISSNNLKQLALAVINYADDHKGRLPADVTDKDGKVLLSWRVLILPYLEETPLFKEFKLDESWDGPTNKKLLDRMPKVFASPRVTVKAAGHTVSQGFAGTGALFEPGKQMFYPASIPDGTSNTIMAVETSVAVPWSRPVDLPFDEKKDLPDFGKAYAATPLAVLCDGSVRTLDLKKVSARTLKAAITVGGGEVSGPNW